MCVVKVTGLEYRAMLLQDTRDHQKGKSQAEGEDAVASVLRLPQSGARMEEQGLGGGHHAGSAPIPAHLGLVRGPGETCPNPPCGALCLGLSAIISALVTHMPLLSPGFCDQVSSQQKLFTTHISAPED